MKKNSIIVVVCVLVHFTCSICSCENKKDSVHINVIPLESTIGQYNIVNLSEYVSEIKYIPLETNDSVLLGSLQLISYENDKILIKDSSQKCYLFDNEGNLCNKIGQLGQGPNDYIYIQKVFLLDNFVFLEDQFKVLIYDTVGHLIKKYNLRSIYDKYNAIGSIIPLKKDTYVMNVYSADKHYPKAVLFETYQSEAAVIKEFPNYIVLNKLRPGNYGYEMGFLYRYNDNIRVYKGINDTIFTIGQNLEMNVAYIFDRGRYKPTIAFLERKEDSKNYNNYIEPNRIYESHNHI